MATSRQKRMLLVASIVAAAGLAGVALLDKGGGPPERRSRPMAVTTQRATVLGREWPASRVLSHVGTPHRAASEDLHVGATPDPAASAAMRSAARVARRFVAALLRVEAEGATPPVRRELRATAVPGFPRFLLRREPRRPLGHRPPQWGRLVALEPLPVRSAVRLELAARIARGGGETGLIVVLRRAGGMWWVATLR